MPLKRDHFILLAPLLALLFYVALSALGLAYQPAATAAITMLTVLWWVSEAIPIPASSLVPFALLPFFGILDHKAVSAALGSHVILLLMGAFILSKALEKSGAHERLALYMVHIVGASSGKRLVFGFVLATGFLSMWISNTATTLIMLPMALAVLAHIEHRELKVALILGIAYAASIGGLGSLIGTPPNVIFAGIYEEETGTEFGFLSWMKIGIPVMIIALPVMSFWLTRNLKLKLKLKLPPLGALRTEEKRALLIFGMTALAWVTRNEPFGGWSSLLGVHAVGDSTVALVAVVVMFLTSDGKGGRIMDWDTARTIPWGMLLLFAGGIAIAKGFNASGLSVLLGNWLTSFAHLPVLLMTLAVCLVVTFLTEVTSNTATATLLMPILASAAISSGADPIFFMIPASMAASCAFMLPVATAPNAIAYGTGEIEIQEMVKNGFALSIIIATIIALCCTFLLPFL